jgi:hypothetical protein
MQSPVNALRGAGRVHVGGIDEIDAGIEGERDHLARRRLVGTIAERHGAEAQRRDIRPLRPSGRYFMGFSGGRLR